MSDNAPLPKVNTELFQCPRCGQHGPQVVGFDAEAMMLTVDCETCKRLSLIPAPSGLLSSERNQSLH